MEVKVPSDSHITNDHYTVGIMPIDPATGNPYKIGELGPSAFIRVVVTRENLDLPQETAGSDVIGLSDRDIEIRIPEFTQGTSYNFANLGDDQTRPTMIISSITGRQFIAAGSPLPLDTVSVPWNTTVRTAFDPITNFWYLEAVSNLRGIPPNVALLDANQTFISQNDFLSITRLKGPTSLEGNHLRIMTDGAGVEFANQGYIYKKAGGGIILRTASGDHQPKIENNNGLNERDILDTDNGVARIGSSMLGPLILYADPVQPLEAATKQYIDSKPVYIGDVTKAGDNAFTGSNSFSQVLNVAVDNGVNFGAGWSIRVKTGNPLRIVQGGANQPEIESQDGTSRRAILDTVNGVSKAGATMTGSLILNADPTSALGAATKQYVDSRPVGGIGDVTAAGNNAFTGNNSFANSHLNTLTDGYGLMMMGGCAIYKRYGGGVTIREHTGGTQPQIEDNNGSNRRDIIDTINGDARYVLKSNPVLDTGCKLRLSDVILTIGNASLHVISAWDTVYDSNNYTSSTYQSVLTAPRTGVYLISAAVSWPGDDTGHREIFIFKGGDRNARYAFNTQSIWGRTNVIRQECNAIVKCNAGDTFEVGIYHTAGNNLSVSKQSVDRELPFFSMVPIGTPK
jgi:hypothetical protein